MSLKKQLPTFLHLPLQHGMFSLLANQHYRYLLISTTLWWQVLFMESIVIGWLVFDLTDSAWAVALVGFYRSAPFLISGFVGGPLTDWVGRRRMIQITQGVAALCYGSIACLLYANTISIWQLEVLSFVLGFCWSLDFPARKSLIPDLIGREKTVDGLLLESFSQGIVRMIGPVLAGYLIAHTGAFGCLVYMTVTSVGALICVLLLGNQPIQRFDRGRSEPAWLLVKQGFRYVGQNPPILAVVLVTVIMNLLIFPYATLMPVFAKDILGQGPAGLGLLGTATGIGAFLGLFLINGLRYRLGEGWIFMVGTICQCLFLALFAYSTLFSFSWTMLFLAGIGQSCFGILQSSIVLLAASDEMRSRSMSTIVLAIGTDPIGKIQTGLLTERFGAPATMGFQALLAALMVLFVALLFPQARQLPTKPTNRV